MCTVLMFDRTVDDIKKGLRRKPKLPNRCVVVRCTRTVRTRRCTVPYQDNEYNAIVITRRLAR
jgi:hypothetical protein